MVYKAGQKLGNYQLERFLGRGGFAEVYLGKHIYLNTYAAIKVLQKQLSEEALANFLQEARIIAGLKHSHIVRVLDFGIEEQHPFLVMAYAPHGTLRRRYRKGQILSPALIVPYVRQIADALYYAHTHKIIHRDVKPENMLLDDDNSVLLSDFGLAVRERSTYHSIHSADSAGTTIYMAPEQLRGKPEAASDQYALGIVLYEWLCGCLPFDGPDISIVVQHLHEAPVPLREHVPTLPEKIEMVVLKALAKNPQQRFASVQELAEAFEEACKDIPVPEAVAVILQKNLSEYGDPISGELPQESLSGESEALWLRPFQGTIPSSNGTPLEQSWSTDASSLQALSLSASLNVSTSMQDTGQAASVDTLVSPIPLPPKASISRRTMLAGIAGIGMLLGGVGIWQFSSHGTAALSTQGGQKSATVVSSSATATNQTSTPHTNGTVSTKKVSGSLPANTNGAAQNGATSPTPSSTNSGKPTATTTPNNTGGSSGVTPTATIPPTTPSDVLTIQIKNPPSSVPNRTTTSIVITTNMGNIAFQFSATYYNLKNQNNTSSVVISGTTDGSGNGSISWTPSLPPGQVISGTYAEIYVSGTDPNGKTISTLSFQVQIVRRNVNG